MLVAAAPRSGFVGAKPQAWTHWVLDCLGYQPDSDMVSDLFPGSGAVAAAIATYTVGLDALAWAGGPS